MKLPLSQLLASHSAQATLVFTLPPGYPSTAAACHVTSARLPRHYTDHLTELLQQEAAASEGSECLHVLAETLTTELDAWCQQQQQQQCSTTANPQPDTDHQQQQQQQQQQHTAPASAGLRRVLLRLDHMRARASYSKTIKQWAAHLNLTGFLLFWQNLILILLEGDSQDIAQYLYLARTVCVDVDASGRKCRERMMDILEDSADSSSSSSYLLTGSATAAALPAGACSDHGHNRRQVVRDQQHTIATRDADSSIVRQPAYINFRELEVASLAEVEKLLSATHPQYSAAGLRKLLGLSSSNTD